METLVKNELNINTFFESKEHYLNFRSAWKKSISEGYHTRRTYENSDGGISKHKSDLTSTHHLIYNALRRRDLHKSFNPLTSFAKLAYTKFDYRSYSGGEINKYLAFDIARRNLDFAVTRYNNGSNFAIDKLMEPFSDTVTPQMLVELNVVLKTIKL